MGRWLSKEGFNTQHPQAAVVAQQPVFIPKGPSQFNINSHPLQQQQQQQIQHHRPEGLPGQLGMRPIVANSSMNPVYTEGSCGGGSSGGPPETKAPKISYMFVRGGNEQDGPLRLMAREAHLPQKAAK